MLPSLLLQSICIKDTCLSVVCSVPAFYLAMRRWLRMRLRPLLINTMTGLHFSIRYIFSVSGCLHGAACSVFTRIPFHTFTQMSSLHTSAMLSDLQSAWPMAICSRFQFSCVTRRKYPGKVLRIHKVPLWPPFCTLVISAVRC